MFLIGEKFVTYLMLFEGEAAIVKMDDYAVPGRENTRSYREYLAFRLASRIGLSVPRTSLQQHPRYGRLSVQRYVHGARKPTLSLLERMATSSLGIRIALFDVLCGNYDRKLDNLLQLGTDIIPIDFNVAFQEMTTGCDFDEETGMILARWFQIRGILSLTSAHRSLLLGEARQIAERLDDAFIRSCLAEIPPIFVIRQKRNKYGGSSLRAATDSTPLYRHGGTKPLLPSMYSATMRWRLPFVNTRGEHESKSLNFIAHQPLLTLKKCNSHNLISQI
jgi:hypothetical protein